MYGTSAWSNRLSGSKIEHLLKLSWFNSQYSKTNLKNTPCVKHTTTLCTTFALEYSQRQNIWQNRCQITELSNTEQHLVGLQYSDCTLGNNIECISTFHVTKPPQTCILKNSRDLMISINTKQKCIYKRKGEYGGRIGQYNHFSEQSIYPAWWRWLIK